MSAISSKHSEPQPHQHTGGSTLQRVAGPEEDAYEQFTQHSQVQQIQQPFGELTHVKSQENSFVANQNYHQQSHSQKARSVLGTAARQEQPESSNCGCVHQNVFSQSQEAIELHMNNCRQGGHRAVTATEGQVCALGNQSQHGNTWVMNGATWMSNRQASPGRLADGSHKHHNKCCNCRDASPSTYHVKCCENEQKSHGASAKLKSTVTVQRRRSQLGMSGTASAAASGINRTRIQTGEFKNTTGDIMLDQVHQNEDCGLHHISKATQLKLSQKVVDHTYRLFGTQLQFAKDVPTHNITTSETLRRLDQKNERWLRFEIELSCKEPKVEPYGSKEHQNIDVDKEIGFEEVLNLSLYDQADPNHLFLANIDKQQFQKLQSRQNLKIENFSAFGCHFQSLLNHCIDQQDGQYICALKNAQKQTSKEDVPLLPGIQVQLFQGSCFRNLLHLELFFRKANDEEARAWIARKQVIAWGIINELSVEIERLEALTVGDCDEIAILQANLEHQRQESIREITTLTNNYKSEIARIQNSACETLTEVKAAHERQVSQMEQSHSEQVEPLQADLVQTKTELVSQTQKLSELNTEHLLLAQKSDDQAKQLVVLAQEKEEVAGEKEALTRQFGDKDKESLEHSLNHQKVQEQIDYVKETLIVVTQEKETILSEKTLLSKEVKSLASLVQTLESEKATLEEQVHDLKKDAEKSKKKKEKLKDEKKDKKKKIKELEEEVEKAESKIEASKEDNLEANQLLTVAKGEIEVQMTIVAELKTKLGEAMETLKMNSETIEFLNKSLTEAQKFSFRALLSSKQNVATGSVAAVVSATQNQQAQTRQASSNRLASASNLTESKFVDMGASQRTRSPYCDAVRVSSNSPLRLLQKQQQNSSLLLNATSFSNVKRQHESTKLNSTQHLTANMRESLHDHHGGAYQGKGCDCKGFQAELKLTNKYASRFGMDEVDEQHSRAGQTNNQYSSFNHTRQSANNYIATSTNQYGGVQGAQNCFTTRSVTYKTPFPPSITAGGQTISSQSGVTDQVVHSQRFQGGLSRSNVQDAYQEDVTVKRDEKESHYSRHVNSKESFGNQQMSYLMQQHQETTLGQQDHHQPSDYNGRSIFGKQIVQEERASRDDGDEMARESYIKTFSAQEHQHEDSPAADADQKSQ